MYTFGVFFAFASVFMVDAPNNVRSNTTEEIKLFIVMLYYLS